MELENRWVDGWSDGYMGFKRDEDSDIDIRNFDPLQ